MGLIYSIVEQLVAGTLVLVVAWIANPWGLVGAALAQPPEASEVDEADDEPAGLSLPLLLVGGAAFGLVVAALGLVAAFAIAPLLKVEPVGSFVTNRTIPPGDAVRQSDVVFVEGLVAPGALVDPEVVVGRVASSEIYAGDPVIEARLAAPGRQTGTASLAPKGYVAMWINAEPTMVGLGLDSGDRVDVWALARLEEGMNLLVPSALVLAYEPGNLAPDRITLALPAEGANAVGKLRSQGGALGLTLVAAADRPAPPADAPPAPPPIDAADAPDGVVHARHTLVAGKPIEAADLVRLPDHKLGLGAVTSADEVLGRVPRRDIAPGERVTDAVLADPAAGRGLAALLASGERAVAIQLFGADTNDFKPGTRIDILSVNREKGEAHVIGEGVEVLGLKTEGEGCPCAALRASEDLAVQVLVNRTANTLGLQLPE